MNRGGIEPPTEGACGDMYRQAAQDKCDEQVNVQYTCGTEVPAEKNTRHEAHVMGNRKEGAARVPLRQSRQTTSRRLADGKAVPREEVTTTQARHDAQGSRNGEVVSEAPVWWMLEVEGHSSNRRNRNRIRKHLRKKLDGQKRRTDISEEVKRAEMKKLQSQLDYYQRLPKPSISLIGVRGNVKESTNPRHVGRGWRVQGESHSVQEECTEFLGYGSLTPLTV